MKNNKIKFLGEKTIFYEEIDSTQKEIWRRIENKTIQNKMLIYSNIQTNGIGTHGRKWYTDEKDNIAFSFYVVLDCLISKIDGITIKIAEIIKNILKEKYQIDIMIKPPNDIYFNGKKMGGILVESKVLHDKIKFLVVGIGLNTNKEKFDEEIKDIATSIKKKFGIEIDNKEFIKEFCKRFEKILYEIGENK